MTDVIITGSVLLTVGAVGYILGLVIIEAFGEDALQKFF